MASGMQSGGTAALNILKIPMESKFCTYVLQCRTFVENSSDRCEDQTRIGALNHDPAHLHGTCNPVRMEMSVCADRCDNDAEWPAGPAPQAFYLDLVSIPI